MSDQRLTRIAIVSSDKCKPKKCRQECKKSCPVVKTGIFRFFYFMISSDLTVLSIFVVVVLILD